MLLLENNQIDEITALIKKGKVGVLPTDTIYGLHALSSNQGAIERIYDLKKRSTVKPFINLISKITHLEKMGISLTSVEKEIAQKYWPGPVSLIFERTGKTIAFRMPKSEMLKNVIDKTGPIVSTSANISGQESASTLQETIDYFGNGVDFYVEGGTLSNRASKVILISDDMEKTIRP